MSDARRACESVACGAFTPIVLERYAHIGGETGWALAYSSITIEGRSMNIYLLRPDSHASI